MVNSEDNIAIDPSTDWGYWLDREGGTWISLPKLPLVRGGYTQPPFAVKRPDGKILHVVERRRE
jgi:hypothetical protein